MTSSTIITYQPKQFVHILLVLLCALFSSYMYFLSSSVIHVVIREETDQLVQQLRSDISTLESKYIAAQHEVSKHISMLEGYDEVTSKTFIDRRSPSLVLGTVQ